MCAYFSTAGSWLIVHDLGHERQVVAIGRRAQQPEPLLAQTLKAVRRTSRLEGSAAQHLGAGALHRRRGRLHLLFGLGRTRAGHHDDLVAADAQVADRDDGVLRPERPARELVRLGDAQHFLDAFEHFEQARIPFPAATDGADHRAQRAGRAVDVEPHFDELGDDTRDLLVGRALLHDHNHKKL